MKIQQMQLKGYRSLKDVTWKPGNLNVLIGPNGAGKSNILRAFDLLSAAADGKLSKYIQSEGGMEAVAWDGGKDPISVSVSTSPAEFPEGPDVYSFQMERLGGGSNYQITTESLVNMAKFKQGRADNPFKMIERDKAHAVVFDEQEHRLTPPAESLRDDETLLSIAGVPMGANRWAYLFRKQLSEITVYHDIHVNSDALIRQASVSRFEKRLAPDGQNLVSVLHTLYASDRDFRDRIDEGMFAAFGDAYEGLTFPPSADQRIQLRIQWKGLRNAQPALNISDGTLRFLLLMSILASPEMAPVVAIDEPETGLHPGMLQIVAAYATEAANQSQIILTTHSPELLSAFHDSVPTTSVLLWENGETSLRTLSPDRLEYWLKTILPRGTVQVGRTGGYGMRFVLMTEGHTERDALKPFLGRWLEKHFRERIGISIVRFVRRGLTSSLAWTHGCLTKHIRTISRWVKPLPKRFCSLTMRLSIQKALTNRGRFPKSPSTRRATPIPGWTSPHISSAK